MEGAIGKTNPQTDADSNKASEATPNVGLPPRSTNGTRPTLKQKVIEKTPSWMILYGLKFISFIHFGARGLVQFFLVAMPVFGKWMKQQFQQGFEEGKKMGKGEKIEVKKLVMPTPYEEKKVE